MVGGQTHEADGKALLFVTQEGFHKALDIDFVGVARVLEGVSPVERGRDECETKGGFCYAGLIVAAGLVAEDDIVCRCERGELIVAEAAPDHGESKSPVFRSMPTVLLRPLVPEVVALTTIFPSGRENMVCRLRKRVGSGGMRWRSSRVARRKPACSAISA